MGHESPIEPWLPLTTCSACESQSSWLHANKTMKTTGRKRQSPQALPLEVDNSTGHNTPTSLRLGWKQDRLQPPEECFLLTSSSIEPMSQERCVAHVSGPDLVKMVGAIGFEPMTSTV